MSCALGEWVFKNQVLAQAQFWLDYNIFLGVCQGGFSPPLSSITTRGAGIPAGYDDLLVFLLHPIETIQ